MHHFNELQLPEVLQRALKTIGFEKPTPIQAKAIPIALQNSDLIGCAQTGTGKTVAFCLPILTRLLSLPGKGALILVPTRELATQISEVLKKLTLYCPEMTSALLIGGAAMQPQTRNLQRKPRVIIATPGRLVDHLNRKSVSLSNIEVLVLDEADRMLDMGFAPQLNEIIRVIPKTRQTLFFSATLPPHIEKLTHRFLKNPVRVTVGAISQPAPKIQQFVIKTTASKKNDTLMDELNLRKGSVLIFARTQIRTDRLNSGLDGTLRSLSNRYHRNY